MNLNELIKKKLENNNLQQVALAQNSVLNNNVNNINFDISVLSYDFSFLNNYDITEEENDIIKTKTKEITLINVKNKLLLGKTLQDVFEILGNQKAGCFKDWLAMIDLNEKTASRYRKMYMLFEKIQNPINKSFIALLSVREVEIACKIFENEPFIFEKTTFVDLQEFKDFLSDRKKIISITNEKTDTDQAIKMYNIERIDLLEIEKTISGKWEYLNEKKKDKINSYFEKILEILEKEEIEEAEEVIETEVIEAENVGE